MTDPLTQLNASLAGRYAVEREIGAGGMATVYLARDLRHERNVAVKVLRAELGAVLGVERFLSEIKVTANLQHPNLLPLFESGEANGLLFYVMPFIEGESLRALLQREKQLSISEAVRIARALADGLEYAHTHGVVHRDLKPENVLLQAGQPVIADFGIALAVSKAGGARITQTGLSLGTPQYMSPEQATGDRAVDARTDVYSLAAMMYEMLAGEPPHTGPTAQAIIAKLMTEEPRPLSDLRRSVPELVEMAVSHGLQKIPADRLPSARAFADALNGSGSAAMSRPVAAQAGAARTARRWRLVALAGWVAAAAGIVFAASRTSAADRDPSPIRFTIALPDSTPVALTECPPLVFSRDGHTLAIVTRSVTPNSGRTIQLRRLDAMGTRPVQGAIDPVCPAFSADGATLMYARALQAIVRQPISGGAPVVVAQPIGSTQFAWSDADTVLYRGSLPGLYKMRADGGESVLAVRADSLLGHRSYFMPHFLPGGRHALVAINTGRGVEAEIGVLSLDGGQVRGLGILGNNPQFIPPGILLVGTNDGTLMAARFSLRERNLAGPLVPVVQSIAAGTSATPVWAVSPQGTLAYLPGQSAVRTLVAVSRAGIERVLEAEPRNYFNARVSPDGNRIAVQVGGGAGGGGGSDVWVYDVAAHTLSRLTTDGRSQRPVWSPDGHFVMYISVDSSQNVIKRQPGDGSGAAEVIVRLPEASPFAMEVGPAHSFIALRAVSPGTRRDIWIAPLDSMAALHPFVATPADEHSPAISPDGRLLAYTSDETGRPEVYVRPLRGAGPRVQISAAGGDAASWSADGHEVIYRSRERFYAARIAPAPDLRVTAQTPLFRDPYAREGAYANYTRLPGGELLVIRAPESESTEIVVVVNWVHEVTRLLFAQQ